MEAVLAGPVAGDARVESGVGEPSGVDDERADSFLVDDDLVQEVRQHFGPVAEPQHVRYRATRHHAVEASQVTFRHLEVSGNLAKYRLEKLLRDAAEVSFPHPARAVYSARAQ